MVTKWSSYNVLVLSNKDFVNHDASQAISIFNSNKESWISIVSNMYSDYWKKLWCLFEFLSIYVERNIVSIYLYLFFSFNFEDNFSHILLLFFIFDINNIMWSWSSILFDYFLFLFVKYSKVRYWYNLNNLLWFFVNISKIISTCN